MKRKRSGGGGGGGGGGRDIGTPFACSKMNSGSVASGEDIPSAAKMDLEDEVQKLETLNTDELFMGTHVIMQDSSSSSSSSAGGEPGNIAAMCLGMGPEVDNAVATIMGEDMDEEKDMSFAEEAAKLAAPHFDDRAVVQAASWTDGGGNTARVCGNGISKARIVGEVVVRWVGEGRNKGPKAGYRLESLAQAESRATRLRPVWWPAELLFQVSLSGTEKLIGGSRTSSRKREQMNDRRLAKESEMRAEEAQKKAAKEMAAAKKAKKEEKVAKKKQWEAEQARDRAEAGAKVAIANLARQERVANSAKAAIAKQKEKHDAQLLALKEINSRMRAKKNDANSRARASLKRAARLERRVASLVAGASSAKAPRSKMREDVKQRLAGADADTVAAEKWAEEAEDELERMSHHIELIRTKIGKESGGSLLPDTRRFAEALEDLGEVVGAAAAAAAAAPARKRKSKKARRKDKEASTQAVPTQTLVDMLGKTDEAYSQDVIELGFSLMAAQLTAPQAVSVMRAFVRAEYPDKKEGTDYRIPDSSRFREWRRYLEPISHYIGVSVLSLSIRSHLLNDATTKNHVHVYQSCFRCELPGEDGETVIVDVPLKFEICPDGKHDAEADQSVEAMTGCAVAEKPSVSMLNVVSSSTDGAARATSRAFGERKKKELEEVQRIVDEDIQNYPDKYKAAVSAYLSLTEEQREAADEFHELGCSGHSLNLVVDDSWKQSEKKAMAFNMARDGKHPDGCSDLPDVSNVVLCTSKSYASSGKHWGYYLNEHRRIEKYARDNNLALRRLPAVQGSRQCINVQLATAILANKPTYLKYLNEVRVESDPNKMLMVVWDGLRDKYVVAALRARSFVDVLYSKPMTFFTHSNTYVPPKKVETWITNNMAVSGLIPALFGWLDAHCSPPNHGIVHVS